MDLSDYRIFLVELLVELGDVLFQKSDSLGTKTVLGVQFTDQLFNHAVLADYDFVHSHAHFVESLVEDLLLLS